MKIKSTLYSEESLVGKEGKREDDFILLNLLSMSNNRYLSKIQEKIENSTNESEKAYYKRMLTLLAEPDLTEVEPHPVKDIVDKIVSSPYYKDFEIIKSPEIVNEYATFDLFFFPKNHVARRSSDSFFIEKNENTK